MAALYNHAKTDSVTLPDNMHWPGEFSGWLPRNQASTRAIDGTLITQTAQLIAGEPIELLDFWLSLSALKRLKTWAGNGGQYWLILPDGNEYLVIFADQSPVQAAPIFDTAAPDQTTKYLVNSLNFLSQAI